MTRIGILGTGRVASNLADKLSAAGHHITFGSRSRSRSRSPHDTAARTPWLGPAPQIAFTDHRTAARTTDIVINATPGDSSLDRLTGLRTELAGKILIDVSNATRDAADGLPGDLCHPGSSLAEKLQAALPDTHVVKTLNTMLFTVMTAPKPSPPHRPPTSRAMTRTRRRPSPACSATWAGNPNRSRISATSAQLARPRP